MVMRTSMFALPCIRDLMPDTTNCLPAMYSDAPQMTMRARLRCENPVATSLSHTDGHMRTVMATTKKTRLRMNLVRQKRMASWWL